jgi:hypothetical protein
MLAARPLASLDRLTRDGASAPAMISRRLLWFAMQRRIPVAEIPKVGATMTLDLRNFCQLHRISFDWLLTGDLAQLRDMLRESPPKTEPKTSTERPLLKLERLSPQARAIVAETVQAMLERAP